MGRFRLHLLVEKLHMKLKNLAQKKIPERYRFIIAHLKKDEIRHLQDNSPEQVYSTNNTHSEREKHLDTE